MIFALTVIWSLDLTLTKIWTLTLSLILPYTLPQPWQFLLCLTPDLWPSFNLEKNLDLYLYLNLYFELNFGLDFNIDLEFDLHFDHDLNYNLSPIFLAPPLPFGQMRSSASWVLHLLPFSLSAFLSAFLSHSERKLEKSLNFDARTLKFCMRHPWTQSLRFRENWIVCMSVSLLVGLSTN